MANRLQGRVESVAFRELDRILARPSRFAAFFSSAERKAMRRRLKPREGLAARLAAKRALHGLMNGARFSYARVEIRNRKTGEPYFYFLNPAERAAVARQMPRLFVSLSHSGTYGFAFVCIEKS